MHPPRLFILGLALVPIIVVAYALIYERKPTMTTGVTYSLILIYTLGGSHWTLLTPGYPSLQACREDAGRLSVRIKPKPPELIGCQEEHTQYREKDFWAPIMPE